MVPASATTTGQVTPFLAVPRDRGDEACEQLSPVAFKVWYRITRLTIGWNREEALISYNDFMRACGIKDRHTISSAIKELVVKGFARVIQNCEATGRKLTSLYSLITAPSGKNPLPFPQITLPAKRVVEKIHQDSGKKSTTPGGKNPLPAACQPAPEAAPREAIETLIETSIEREEIRIAPADAVQDELLSLPIASKETTHTEAPHSQTKARPRDELWDAAVDIFGFSPEGSAASLWGKKLSLMRKRSTPVSPEELQALAAAYQRKYPNATFSLAAIEAHIDDLRIFIRGKGAARYGQPEPEILANYL